MTDKLGNLRTPQHDSFLAGLSEDGNGNIFFMKADNSGEEHTIMVQVTFHTNQKNKSKIERIIDESKDIKDKIISNPIEKIKDQNQKNTTAEFASALDLAQKCDKATCIECLKQLYVIYGTEYIHVLFESKLHYED